jgi:hypothetical protein
MLYIGPLKVNLTANNLLEDNKMVRKNLQNAYVAGNTCTRNAGTLIRMPKIDQIITNLILRLFIK